MSYFDIRAYLYLVSRRALAFLCVKKQASKGKMEKEGQK